MNTIFDVTRDDSFSWWIHLGLRDMCAILLSGSKPLWLMGNISLWEIMPHHGPWRRTRWTIVYIGDFSVLRDVYFAPNISRNLVSNLVLNQLGYKLLFEADRCIISKNRLFVLSACLSNSLFKLFLNLNKDVVCNAALESSNEKGEFALFVAFEIRTCWFW